ncbi:hypothetical protein JMN32_14325 [Fulvivirga sp. 29W222]|uniref:Uncharacterized protein n=1 Tax=Fulvivirga marina TaxID=2494733 RepID=A0A937G2Z9_9BACT|nr:hypothetical protein [Fulvivirga marina]MBL6447491.1 hypothetical protein [Fulvivirga marina]
MWQTFRYLFFLLCMLGFNAFSQSNSGPAVPKDTVRVMLNDGRAHQVLGISDEFQMAWVKLPKDQQDKIIAQVSVLMNSKNGNKKTYSAYFSAIAHAVNTEGADAQKMINFLNVTEKVIDNHTLEELLQYLQVTKSFFEHNALYHAKSNRLYVSNDEYYFEYVDDPASIEVEEEPVEEDPYFDETADDEYFDEWNEEPADDDWDTEWEDDNWEDETYSEGDVTEDQQMVEAIRGGPVLPVVSGPVIQFDNATLNFSTPYDSVFLENTKGSFLILKKQFVGDGGKFDWSMTGLGADSVFCKFSTYSFDVNKPSLQAEAVKLTYKGKLDEPLEGVFKYKSVRHDTTTDAEYPRFMSYYSNIRVKNIGKDLIYHGGFSLKGSKIYSSSVLGDFSRIEVHDKASKKFRAKAKIFEFSDSTVTASRASIVIYQGSDSIYHPAVRFKYDFENKYLVLQKDKGGFRNTPYTATYFNIDFTADIIRWHLDSASLDASILEGRQIVPAHFESSDHFNVEDYRGLGDQIYPFNPLALVVAYSRKKHEEKFYVDQLARHYKKDVRVIKGAMLFLAQKGLIGYDSNKGLITVKDKGKHLFDSKFGKKDFDNIIISSVIHHKANSTLNFEERTFKVRGVDGFKISDSLNVIIKPDSSEIVLMRDRDFKFNGKVTAGNFEYIGRDFTFKYDSFLIYLNEIDSIQFYVKDENSRGRSGRRKVDNALVSVDSEITGDVTNNLQASSGTLFVNKPGNKSGKVNLPNYPKFDSGKGAVVYFDRKEVLSGVYDRSMYFLVPPFGIDSLSGSDPASIGFQGSFVSSGMFPTFEEKLEIQPDYSLGFTHEVPTDGYTLYEGEGKFYNQLTLNKKGLRGHGRIDFLTTTMVSEDFIFYPDSVVAQGDYVEISEEEYNGVLFPQASVKNYEMKWLPKKDSMYISNVEDPIQFYNETASLDGTAIVSNKGVYGSGTLLTRGSESKSDRITFKHNRFSARHADFELKSDNPDKPALSGDDVYLRFNLDENYADISPEVEGQAAFEFPYAQFKTSITQARWDLNEEKITMRKPEDVPLESSYFYTTREDLDSLRFNATEAVYDINTLELKVSGIPYIVVADAKITPENNEVLILENSKIGRLTNTTIILDTLHEYHRLTEGVIDIKSRNEFTGYATYQFVNALNDTVPIKMENFHLEEIQVASSRKKEVFKQHTVANGSVSELQNILISPGMFYKGDMTLYAHKPAMQLDGYVKLDLHEPGYNTWIEHSSTGDQRDVMINFDNSVTEEGRRLEAGLFFSLGDNSLYSTFISERYSPDDEEFFVPSGILHFDKNSNEYAIEDTLKMAGKKLSGKVYRYNQDTRDIRFEGPVNFMRPSKDVSINAAVLGDGNIDRDEYKLNSMLAVDFSTLPAQAFSIMAMDIVDVINNLGAPEGLGDQTQLLYKLAEIIGERPAREYEKLSLEEYVSMGGFAKETAVSLVFTNVDLKWSPDYKAFYSEGKLGMSNIQRTDVNGAFDGFMEIKKNEDGGTVFNIFIKASPASWFYFSLEDDRLLTYSSNENYNAIISKKSNGSKAKIGDLIFSPADKAETLNFINRFRLEYYGIDEFYDLDSEVEEVVDETPDDGFGGTEEDDGFEDDDDGF